MRVLSLDSASPRPALAIADAAGHGPVVDLPAAAAEALPAAVAEALGTLRLSVSDLDRVAVLSGPGSFTGLRAGIAFARGLARARGIPLDLVPTFRAAAEAVPGGDVFLLDAGRGDVHAASRTPDGLAVAPAPRPRAEVLNEASAAGRRVVDLDAAPLPLAAAAARLAAAGAAAGAVVYGRPSAAEEKLAAAREGPP